MARSQVTGSPDEPDLLFLPWHVPLEEWPADQLVALPRGISRHVVRFVRLNGVVYAVKEVGERAGRARVPPAARLDRLDVPCVEAVGVVTGRTTPDGERARAGAHHPAPAVLAAVPRVVLLDAAAGHREPAARRAVAAARPAAPGRASPGTTARCPTRCSGATPARSRRTSSTPRPASCTSGCPTGSASTTSRSRASTSSASSSTSRPAACCTSRSTRCTPPTRSSGATDGCGTSSPSRSWSHAASATWSTTKVRRLNDLGFDVAEFEVIAESDGTHVRVQPKVVDAGHHTRRLLRLTGLDVAGEPGPPAAQRPRRLPGRSSGCAEEDEEVVAHRWVAEVFEPVVRRCRATCAASSSRPRSSTRCSSTGGSCPSAPVRTSGSWPRHASYVTDVLAHQPVEQAVLGKRIGTPSDATKSLPPSSTDARTPATPRRPSVIMRNGALSEPPPTPPAVHRTYATTAHDHECDGDRAGAGRAGRQGRRAAVGRRRRATSCSTIAGGDPGVERLGRGVHRDPRRSTSQVSPTSRDRPWPSDPTTSTSGSTATSRSSRLDRRRRRPGRRRRSPPSRYARSARVRLVARATGTRAAAPADAFQAPAVIAGRAALRARARRGRRRRPPTAPRHRGCAGR